MTASAVVGPAFLTTGHFGLWKLETIKLMMNNFQSNSLFILMFTLLAFSTCYIIFVRDFWQIITGN